MPSSNIATKARDPSPGPPDLMTFSTRSIVVNACRSHYTRSRASQPLREVLGDYDEENAAWSHYQSAVEIYGLMKHHLPDVTALEGQVDRVEDFRSRFRRGERRRPDGDWALSDALATEAALFVSLLRDAVAKALYGTD